ncbi:Ni/Fe-hydrogenase cytochrome b subunit, partial [bacterium]|nr:Ni/Fe-hydrogenase cytochrome b subunit [bacterium]
MSENTATNNRLIATKAVLWFLTGAALTVAAVRFARGLGRSTALSDTTPWGMWIGFDVLSGVALAAGGFVVAATVHVFGRERYHGIVRPAILTAFLGYLGVIVGLLVDLGRPWNIIQVIFHQNLHSPLFEVAMCVMLYTTVLALEFAPVALEKFERLQPAARFLRKLVLPLVIAGICLSTLHQSSLGTLFLLTEGRMHPLWYSPVQTPLFLISAIALGLGMVTLEGVITSWLYKRKAEWPLFAGLTRAAAGVLGLYLALRLGDLGVRGLLGHAIDGSWTAVLFWVELSMSALVPILLFTLPRCRGQAWATGWGALLVVAGFVLHRADVGGISHMAVTGETYVPALTEVVTSAGIVAGLVLVFLFFVEKLKIWEDPPAAPGTFDPPAFDPVGRQFIGAPWLGGGQRAALAVIVGAVLGVILAEAQIAARAGFQASPVESPRNVLVTRSANPAGPGHSFDLVFRGGQDPAADTELHPAVLIDSGGAGRCVPFEHRAHEARLGGQQACALCHHRNLPLDRATSCSRCHRDMYEASDTFSHARHETALGGRESCVSCHADPDAPKNRVAAKACDDCHHPPHAEETLVRSTVELPAGVAPG